MSVIKKNIPGIGLCICAFFIHSAVGQQTVQGGVIHFRGAIVEHCAIFLLMPKILI